jgi:hypothetical protein
MVAVAIEREAPRSNLCLYCGAGIRWVRSHDDTSWVALDAEPHPLGPYVVSRTARALPIPPEMWALFNDEGQGRWRPHSTSCSRVGRLIGDSLRRWQSGDTRRAGQTPTLPQGVLVRDGRRPRDICDDCGLSIIWATHRYDDGKVPLDDMPATRGYLAFVDDNDPRCMTVEPVVVGLPNDGRRHYRSHHVTCLGHPSWKTKARVMRGWYDRGTLETDLDAAGIAALARGPRLSTEEQRSVVCPKCSAAPRSPCIGTATGARVSFHHPARIAVALIALASDEQEE